MALNIGLNVQAPSVECKDVNCPFHGTLPVLPGNHRQSRERSYDGNGRSGTELPALRS